MIISSSRRFYLSLLLFMLLASLVEFSYAYNPCCSFPCQHRGVCVTKGNDYSCDCTRTGYHGEHCQDADFGTLVSQVGQPGVDVFQQNEWLWNIVNQNKDLRRQYMKTLVVLQATDGDPVAYNSAHPYTTLDAYFNKTYYTRALPPVPHDCPTPLGVVGKAELPDAEEVGYRLFKRREFIPDPAGSNLLFAYYAQHFSHTALKTDYKKGPGFTWGTHHIDGSNIYGPDEEWRRQLRTFQDGKMKTRRINGEDWPPSVAEANVKMVRRPGMRDEDLFALGHTFFNVDPGLMMFSTVWLREHNRVCDVMKQEHPEWDDEQLYQTARLIVTGEVIKVTLEAYIRHVGKYKFALLLDPTVMYDDGIRFHHSATVEYQQLYLWHQLVPDIYLIGDKEYALEDLIYNTDVLIKGGLYKMVDSSVRQVAGKVGARNNGNGTLYIAVNAVKNARKLRMQPFNEYRKRFRLPTYKSFLELTAGDESLARDLEDLYGNIDAVEFFVGLMVEEPRRSVLGDTIGRVGAATTYQGIMGSPLMSSAWWKPSTFGGDKGFSIVNDATLEKLFCQNMNPCPHISFKVPS